MSYTRVNWKDLPSEETPLTAENLNRMDEGIYNIENSKQISENIFYNAGIVIRKGTGDGIVATNNKNNFFIVNAWDVANRGTGNYYFRITGQFAADSTGQKVFIHSHKGMYTVNSNNSANTNIEINNYNIAFNNFGTINIAYTDGKTSGGIWYSSILFIQ